MSAPTGTRPDGEQLLQLVDRTSAGPLTPTDAAQLRAAIHDLSRYREWCAEWSRLHTRLRATAYQRLRALRRALARAQRGRLAEVELARLQATLAPAALGPAGEDGAAYEQLLVAELLDGFALARAAARLDPVTRHRSAA